jgi:hypothetical protein
MKWAEWLLGPSDGKKSDFVLAGLGYDLGRAQGLLDAARLVPPGWTDREREEADVLKEELRAVARRRRKKVLG